MIYELLRRERALSVQPYARAKYADLLLRLIRRCNDPEQRADLLDRAQRNLDAWDAEQAELARLRDELAALPPSFSDPGPAVTGRIEETGP